MAMADTTKDISKELTGVKEVMSGDMGVIQIIKNDQVFYQRESSYLYLQLYSTEE